VASDASPCGPASRRPHSQVLAELENHGFTTCAIVGSARRHDGQGQLPPVTQVGSLSVFARGICSLTMPAGDSGRVTTRYAKRSDPVRSSDAKTSECAKFLNTKSCRRARRAQEWQGATLLRADA